MVITRVLRSLKTYTASPFMNVSALSLIKLVRTKDSKFLMVNWESTKPNTIIYYWVSFRYAAYIKILIKISCLQHLKFNKMITLSTPFGRSTFTLWTLSDSHKSSKPPLHQTMNNRKTLKARTSKTGLGQKNEIWTNPKIVPLLSFPFWLIVAKTKN